MRWTPCCAVLFGLLHAASCGGEATPQASSEPPGIDASQQGGAGGSDASTSVDAGDAPDDASGGDASLGGAAGADASVDASDDAATEAGDDAEAGAAGAGGSADAGPGPVHVWSRLISDTFTAVTVSGVAIDSEGNIVVAGKYCDQIYPYIPCGLFLASYDAAGTPRWSKTYENHLAWSLNGFALDQSGNAYIGGRFKQKIDLGGGELTSLEDGAFLAAYGPSGNHLWSKAFDSQVGGYDLDSVTGVAVDAAGNLVVTGSGPRTDLGGGSPSQCAGWHTFLASFDPTGVLRWAKYFCNGSFWRVGVGPDGALLVAGYHWADLDLGGTVLTTPGLLLASFDANGEVRWSKDLGADADVSAIAYDGAGNSFLTGGYTGTIDFGGGPLPSAAGSSDGFLASLQPDGGHRWSRRFGTGFDDCTAASLTVDTQGRPVLTGPVCSAIDYGGGPLAPGGEQAMFLASFDVDGSHRWSRRYGDSFYAWGYGITTAPNGTIIVAGEFDGTIDLGGGPLVAFDDPLGDGLVAALLP